MGVSMWYGYNDRWINLNKVICINKMNFDSGCSIRFWCSGNEDNFFSILFDNEDSRDLQFEIISDMIRNTDGARES